MIKNKRFVTFTIFVCGAFAVLIALGSWQVKRLLWKNELIANVNSNLTMPPVDISDVDSSILSDLYYRKVRLVGHFIHDQELHFFVGPRYRGGDSGYNIIVPFRLENASFVGSDYVLIDRGWVPAYLKNPQTRPDTLVADKQEIFGIIYPKEHKRWFTPENDIENNIWFWVDIDILHSVLELPPLPGVYIRMVEEGTDVDAYNTAEDDLPVLNEVNINIINNHLYYAITWYSLAIILLVIYVIAARKLKKS